jgi:hypothetical protein
MSAVVPAVQTVAEQSAMQIIICVITRPPHKHVLDRRAAVTWKQGCQMVCFQTKNPNLGEFWRALVWKMLVNFKVICKTLRSFGVFYGHLVMLW